MRVMIKAILPVETANKAVTDGSLGDTIGSILGDLKPEATYFGLQEGSRTAFIVVDVTDSAKLPRLVEPFFLAFNALGMALRYDIVIVLSLLPLTLGLFFKFRKENSKKADSILVLILTALLAGPVVSMLTDFYSVMPYRFLPLIVFVAVSIGVLLSKKN